MVNELYRKTIGKQGFLYSAFRYLLRLYNNIIFPLEVKMKQKQTLSKQKKCNPKRVAFIFKI